MKKGVKLWWLDPKKS